MIVRIGTIVTRDTGGNAVRIEGNVEVQIGSLESERTGGDAVAIYEKSPFIHSLGLPPETNPGELVALLTQLAALPEPDRKAKALEPGFLARLGKFTVESTTVANNLLSIVANPSVQAIIQKLGSA